MLFVLNSYRFFAKINRYKYFQEVFQMKKPATILSIILAAITLTSSNVVVPNQSGLKLSSITPGFTSNAMPTEDMSLQVKETIWMI